MTSAVSNESGSSVQKETTDRPSEGRLPIPFTEFVALGAMLIALTALSIDIMLPALPRIASEFGLQSANDRQLVVFGYLVGLGPGQIIFGPLSDRFGRRPVILIGLAIYICASAVALITQSFETLLAARAMQGFGGAAPRTVLIASVRDLFKGHQMARVMSLIMSVFLFVPVIAPTIGQGLIALFHWNAPFYFLLVFGTVAFIWALRRMPETHDVSMVPGGRIGLGTAILRALTNRQTLTYLLASGFMIGCLMSYIASSQQIFVDIYKMGPLFPLAFGGTALAMIAASITNSTIVMRLGTRCVSHTAIFSFLIIAVIHFIIVELIGQPPVAVTWMFLATLMFLFGLTMQNFNALAMEPQGAIAGMASSILGTYTTLAGACFGWLVGRAFDGTTGPISVGFALLSLAAIVTILVGDRSLRVFRSERRI
jgi:MFS transporter, DHA1 family, multidrug resistance protein